MACRSDPAACAARVRLLAARAAGVVLSLALSGLVAMPGHAQDAETVRASDRGVFRVVTNRGTTGSAFLVNGEGVLVTNAHVAEPGRKVYVLHQTAGGNDIYRTDILARDAEADLAVIRARDLPGHPITIARGAVDKGQAVFALGFPAVADMNPTRNPEAFIAKIRESPSYTTSSHSSGAVSRVVRESWPGRAGRLDIVQHSAALHGGSSGGPLMDLCGNVVGVNTAVIGGSGSNATGSVYLASAVSEITRFLDRNGVRYDRAARPCLVTASTVSDGPAARQPKADTAALATGGDNRQRLIVTLAVLAIVVAVLLILMLVRWRGLGRGVGRRHVAAGGPDLSGLATGTASPGYGPVRVHRQTAVMVHQQTGPPQTRTWRIKFEGPEGKTGFHVTSAPGMRASVIGRDQNVADLLLANPGVSRRHAKLHRDDGGLVIEDLGSTNGTFVNGTRVQPGKPLRLRPGDGLSLGKLAGRVQQD